MELLVRVRWRHVSPADLRIEVEPHHTVRDLISSASNFCDGKWDESQPVFLERSAMALSLESPIVDSGIVSGDTIRFELYGVDFVDRQSLSEAVSCDVTAGPEAGRSFVLLPGRHEAGRHTDFTVALEDVTVSEHQLSVIVYDDLVTRLVPDPGAINPLVVNGRTITDSVVVGPNDVVQFGATAVSFRVFSRSSDDERDQLGQVPFRRTPAKPVIVSKREFKQIGGAPTKPDKRRFPAAMLMAPVVMGLAMYAMTRQPTSLMMMAMSPMMAVSNHLEGRKSGAERYSTSIEKFRGKLEKRKAEVEQALLGERAERIHQSPDLADLARRATLRTLDLWPRQRSDDAFLRTRLGIGTVASKVRVEPETSGEDHIKEAAAATLAGHDRLMACPIAVNLKDLGVFGLHGPEADVKAMCSSVIVQAVTLHSPEDLVLVIIEGAGQGLGAWAKWLPHTRSATSPLSGRHIVEDEGAAADMMRELLSVARLRTVDVDTGDRSDHRWPWILVVLDESADVDPAIASQLLELCPDSGISVVAAVGSDARIPRQAKATLDCRPPHGGALSSVWFTDAETPSEQFEPEPANARLIDQVAMSLAPLRDATAASATAAIPRVVPLLSLFGPEHPTPMSVASVWAQNKPYGLRAPIGIGPAGPLELDLVEHGPHALIGGTSGAGKSELLQSIVASLISQYPPTRLTFLFVDYKGGASSTVFNDVPHTVGYVTNLEASLSLRALTSLRAELNYRMRLMEGKAKDLSEMLERYPDEAPPSLVIVVDEFATLVKEVPDFVAGVVDIAQRGRSLGVHLILATQRPSGSVNDNILANTNLRISLRMLDGTESQTIIGVKAAADIPLPLKGRGFAKLGPRDLIEFQSAYTGAPLAEKATATPVIVSRFGSIARPGASSTTGWRRTSGGSRVTPGTSGGRFTPVPNPEAPTGVASVVSYDPLVDETGALAPPMSAPMQPPEPPPTLSPPVARERVPTLIAFPDQPPTTSAPPSVDRSRDLTHLDVLLNAVRGAMPNLPPPRKPWREMLPEELLWRSIERPAHTSAPGRAGRFITLGMLDDPSAQAQYPAVFDLEEGGGLLVAGGGGSGKTTALRTAALAAVSGASPQDVALYVIDCASRSLGALRGLPHCAGVATGDDLESLTRVIARLARELDRRRGLLSDLSVQAETLSAYLDKGHSMPRIVVLIDGFQNVGSIVGAVQSMVYGPLDWLAELHRVITDGRQVGIHTILTTDRRQAVPALVMSAVGLRLVLRQTDENAYSDYGIPMAIYRGLDLPGGRGLWNNQLVQVGLISLDPSAASQAAAIAEFGAAARRDEPLPAELVTSVAPDDVFVPLRASRPTRATLGRSDVFNDVVEIDVEHAGVFVVGPPRSGRTTALRQIARSLVAGGYDVWSVGLGPDASREIGGPGRHTTGKGDAVSELINDFAALCESLPKDPPYVLIIDNVDRYGDPAILSAFERIQKAEASRTIAATESRFHSGYTQNTMLQEVRLEPTVLILQPETAADVLASTGVRPQLRPGYKMRPGRGVLIVNRQPVVVQVAVDTED